MLKVAKKPEERLVELMEVFNVTQADVCNKAHISRSTISRCLSGKRELTLDKAKLIAQAFDVSPAWMMGFDVEIDQHRRKKETIMQSYMVDTTKGKLLIELHNITQEMTESQIRQILTYAEFLNRKE